MARTRTPEHLAPLTLPNRKSPWESTEQEQTDRQAAVEAHLQVLRSQLAPLLVKLARIPDPRRPGSIHHKLTVLLAYGMLLFVYQYTSRREGNRELSRPALWEALRTVFPDLNSIPHADTLERLLERIPPESIEDALLERIRSLIRHRKLQALMVQKHYIIAIDGTQKLVRDQPWADEALRRRTGGGEVHYAAYVLEAVLVGPQGLTLPIATEFCANPAGQTDPTSKQDCEQKAFARLAGRLKAAFPHLRILVVADGLYPNGPVIALCRRNCWDFMIVLPQDCLPSVWREAEALNRLSPENAAAKQWGDRQQQFWWANDIDYRYGPGDRLRLTLHVVVCEETWTEHRADGSIVERHARFAWVSGQPLQRNNLQARCNRAARHRWDIEENILAEKHHGYQASHAFSWDWNAMRAWHALMQIGRLLNTLACYSIHLWDSVQQRGFRGTLHFLRESYTGRWLDYERLRALTRKPPQLRLVI